ncbi:OadG family protein [bacterium]|nr:OadG family protein [bacterium]
MPETPHLVAYCFIAMLTVASLLSIMAIIIWGITAVFPGKVTAPPPRRKKPGSARASSAPTNQTDQAVVAAISTAAAGAHPGMVVTNIQELKQ